MSRHVAWAWVLVVAVGVGPVAAQQGGFLGKTATIWQKELARPDAGGRRSAAFALGKIGNRAAAAVPELKRLVREDSDARVREAAAIALGEIARESLQVQRDDKLASVLGEALAKDSEPLVRRSAALALGCMGKDGSAAVPALLAALEDKNAAVRQNVCWALGKVGEGVVVGLRKGLRDADALVQRDAALALTNVDPADARVALPDLFEMCKPKNSETRRAALAVLVKAVNGTDGPHADALRDALEDSDEEVRIAAAVTLSNIGGQPAAAAVPTLVRALHGSDAELRRQSAAALRNIGPFAKSALPDLMKALDDPDDGLRRNAALALAGLGDAAEEAYPRLVKMVQDDMEKPETRIDAAVALARMGDVPPALRAVPALLKVVGDPRVEPRVRERVIWALRVHNARLRTLPDVYDTFLSVLAEGPMQNNRMLRYDCAFMMGMLQGPSVRPIVLDTLNEFLKDDKIQIYVGTKVNVVAGGNETGGGNTNRADQGKGDGRTMALKALFSIGPARVAKHAGIVQQLRVLSADMNIDGELRSQSRQMLQSLKGS